MRKVKGVRLRVIQALLLILTVIILLPMIQTFLYSFSSMEEMKDYMKTRGSYDTTRWMDPHLVPNRVSLGQYYQILITDNTVLHLFINIFYTKDNKTIIILQTCDSHAYIFWTIL